MCDCLLHRDGAMNVKIDSVLNGQSGILATVFLGFMQDRVDLNDFVYFLMEDILFILFQLLALLKLLLKVE